MERVFELVRMLGRGPGYILLAAFIFTGLFILAWYQKDVAALAGPLTALGLGVYGGGALKAGVSAYAKVKSNGGNGGTPKSK